MILTPSPIQLDKKEKSKEKMENPKKNDVSSGFETDIWKLKLKFK